MSNSKPPVAKPGRKQPPLGSCCIYVDADNQPAGLSGALLRALRDRHLAPCRAEIFGNTKSSGLAPWAEQLRQDAALASCVSVHEVPCFDQSADVSLMLALGGSLDKLRRDRTHVVIVSRDNVLLACAQRLKDFGLRVLVVHHIAPASRFKVPRLALTTESDPDCVRSGCQRVRPARKSPGAAAVAVPC